MISHREEEALSFSSTCKNTAFFGSTLFYLFIFFFAGLLLFAPDWVQLAGIQHTKTKKRRGVERQEKQIRWSYVDTAIRKALKAAAKKKGVKWDGKKRQSPSSLSVLLRAHVCAHD